MKIKKSVIVKAIKENLFKGSLTLNAKEATLIKKPFVKGLQFLKSDLRDAENEDIEVLKSDIKGLTKVISKLKAGKFKVASEQEQAAVSHTLTSNLYTDYIAIPLAKSLNKLDESRAKEIAGFFGIEDFLNN